MFLRSRVSVSVNVILWVLVKDGRPSVILQQRKTINSGITTRLRASQRPTGGWLKEACPDSWLSHSPDPWQWALSHRIPVNPGGQWHRWWWWHVPPFWQRSIALSHTRAAENTRQKGQRRQEGVINRSRRDTPIGNINGQVHRAQATTSCPVCIYLSLKSTADTSLRVRSRTSAGARARLESALYGRSLWAAWPPARKTRRFYGFVGIFRGTEGSREILAKQKEQTNHGSDDAKWMIRESKASSSLWDKPSLQDKIWLLLSHFAKTLREQKEERGWTPGATSVFSFEMQITDFQVNWLLSYNGNLHTIHTK